MIHRKRVLDKNVTFSKFFHANTYKSWRKSFLLKKFFIFVYPNNILILVTRTCINFTFQTVIFINFNFNFNINRFKVIHFLKYYHSIINFFLNLSQNFFRANQFQMYSKNRQYALSNYIHSKSPNNIDSI